MKYIFDTISKETSKLTTWFYSTSFSLGIKMFEKKYREPIYGIYGFVRLADEIVDTFHEYNKRKLFEDFKKDAYDAVEEGISLNPILNSFQHVVHEYKIEKFAIDQFLKSMEMDLEENSYDREGFDEYVLGSAEVVGLMCLSVFCEGDQEKYRKLKPRAMKLGAAYQKINFLRDLKADYYHLGRDYFSHSPVEEFGEEKKKIIEKEIDADFKEGFRGIRELPPSVGLGVYLSYVYYYALFRKIRNIPASEVIKRRIRISNFRKYMLLIRSVIIFKLRLI